jgi:hypothetical protein
MFGLVWFVSTDLLYLRSYVNFTSISNEPWDKSGMSKSEDNLQKS